MSSISNAISSELKKKYGVDEFFYPDISMNIQIPNGFEGEIFEIVQLLEKNHFEIDSMNVYHIMQLKKKFLGDYHKRKKILEAYQKLLETKVRPIGMTIPLDLVFVNGLVIILLSIVARFGLSFADEAGKIAARKLLDDEKKQAKKYNMTIEEYRFLQTEVKAWIEEGTTIKSFVKKMKIKIKKKKMLNK
jgi:hypothetical protein